MIKFGDKLRFYVYVLPGQVAELDELAKKTGKKRTELVTLAFIAGLEALKMAFNPNMETYYRALDKMYPPEISGDNG